MSTTTDQRDELAKALKEAIALMSELIDYVPMSGQNRFIKFIEKWRINQPNCCPKCKSDGTYFIVSETGNRYGCFKCDHEWESRTK